MLMAQGCASVAWNALRAPVSQLSPISGMLYCLHIDLEPHPYAAEDLNQRMWAPVRAHCLDTVNIRIILQLLLLYAKGFMSIVSATRLIVLKIGVMDDPLADDRNL